MSTQTSNRTLNHAKAQALPCLGWDGALVSHGPRHRSAWAFMGVALLLVIALAPAPTWAQTESTENAPVPGAGGCYVPPPPKPAQASGAEGMPPLPLPAVPLRRTEKKNPPRPPVIAIKINTGDMVDWNTDPNDINNLLNWLKTQVGTNFTYDIKRIDEIDLEADNVPVLYRTGHQPFEFTPEQRQRLREYILRGGMMIFDPCWGQSAYADCVRSEMAQILPEYPMKKLALDHPIYNCYYESAGLVEFTPHSGRSPGPADLEGVEINCRLAVVLSPYDLSCGWDMHTNTKVGGSWVESSFALKLGANMISYATATRDMGVSAAESKAFVDADEKKTDKFRVGQLVHAGDWNPDEVGLRNLLDVVASSTTLRVSFETQPVQPNFEQLSKFPFVYMTGHSDFEWDEAQVAAVRQYLQNGGFLFADACCGRQQFDVALRRELGKVLGASEKTGGLTPLPAKHPLYTIQHQITAVQLTEAAAFRAQGEAVHTPKLEAASHNGRIVVVYSPLALNVGWRLKPVPYAVGYAPQSAIQLGTNVVVFALTQ